jgi:hypothetical protein
LHCPPPAGRARIERASFLTLDEKRAAVGYAPAPQASVGSGDSPTGSRPRAADDGAPSFGDEVAPFVKYDPNQPRAPAGDSDGGQWTSGGGGSSGRVRVAQAVTGTLSDAGDEEGLVEFAQARGGRGSGSARRDALLEQQRIQLEIAEQRVANARARLRELDPEWKPQTTARSSDPDMVDANARIRALTMDALEAEAHITRVQRGGA